MAHSKKRNKSPGTNPKEIQALNLLKIKRLQDNFLKYAQWHKGEHRQIAKQIQEKGMNKVRLSTKR